MSSPGWALLLVRRSLSIRFVFTHPSDSPLSLHGVSVHPASPAERPLWPKEPQSIRPLYVCVSRFYALALAEGFLLKWLNGADHLVQAGRRRMFLVSEVCVLTWARVQAWVSEHAACAHVLTLWIFPGTQMIPFLTLSPPPKLLLILPTTYPCHVLLDSSSSSPMNCVCVSVWLACAHIKLVELSYVTGYSILDVCKLLTSILYMSLLCSPIPPTEFVLPPSAQWSMSCTLCSRDRTEGKRPLACSPSDSQKQPSWPTKTQHEATKWQPVQPLLL